MPPAVTSSTDVSEPERLDREAVFLRLYSANQSRIFAYIFALLPSWHDAQDVLQETSVVLWRAFDEFQPGTDFRAWACKTALHQVLSFRQRQKRIPCPTSDEFFETVAAEMATMDETLDNRLQALARCVKKLPQSARDLLRRCYHSGLSTRQVAAEMGRPAGTIYKELSRIRRRLFACVEKTLASEERT